MSAEVAACRRISVKPGEADSPRVEHADGVWRISHTGYERIYEQMVSFDDVPSFQLTANKFA